MKNEKRMAVCECVSEVVSELVSRKNEKTKNKRQKNILVKPDRWNTENKEKRNTGNEKIPCLGWYAEDEVVAREAPTLRKENINANLD